MKKRRRLRLLRRLRAFDGQLLNRKEGLEKSVGGRQRAGLLSQ
jgi:hypothetical protein